MEPLIKTKDKCRICKKEFEGKYILHFCDDCWNDHEKRKRYYEKLEKKRKYKKGEPITSLDELAEQEFIYFGNVIYHKGWFQNWSLVRVCILLKNKLLYKAIKKKYEIMEVRN